MKIMMAIDKYAIKSCLNKISPTNGISDNKKISILGKEGTVFPTKGAPAKPVKPVAKIVNPSPVAT